jgi:hypothetical protein
MSTPSIQTLITQAQQVLNLKSTNEIRATLAAVLANANVGTPLNPNLTTQQLWDEFYEIVRQPSDDIMSIVVDQMMRMVFSPPAPGGAGADKQVIFNDGGVLAGDAGLTYNKATDALTITGALTVDTTTLVVNAAGYTDRVGIGTATPTETLEVKGTANFYNPSGTYVGFKHNVTQVGYIGTANAFITGGATTNFGLLAQDSLVLATGAGAVERYKIDSTGVATWSNVGGVAGTAMTLNSTGLGIGASPGAKLDVTSTNNAFNAIQARYNSSNPLIGFGIANSNGYAYLGFNTKSKTTSDTATYEITNTATQLRMDAGQFRFNIAASGTAGADITFTQAMTLTATGALLVGCTTAPNPGSPTTASGFSINGIGNDAYISQKIDDAPCGYFRRDGTDGTVFSFNKANSNVGTIAVTALATTYNSISDYRLKEAVQPIVGGLDRVNALKPSIYKWKVNGSAGEGFIAHELADIVPAAVTGEKDAVNADGTISPQGVDMSRIVPILVAAIQELSAEVNALKNA